MTTRRYGLSRGDEQIFVTEAVGVATVNDDVEVTFDLAVNLEQAEVFRLHDKTKEHIATNDFPPA